MSNYSTNAYRKHGVSEQDRDTMENEYAVFFWRNPCVFNNWCACEFIYKGIAYRCSEQALMHQKALLMGDAKTAAEMLLTHDPALHKKLGRKVKGFDQAKWNQHKEQLMYEILLAKFSQNEAMKQQLLQTGTKYLGEASCFDKVWGIGVDSRSLIKYASWTECQQHFRGENLLGKALMRVRKELAP